MQSHFRRSLVTFSKKNVLVTNKESFSRLKNSTNPNLIVGMCRRRVCWLRRKGRRNNRRRNSRYVRIHHDCLRLQRPRSLALALHSHSRIFPGSRVYGQSRNRTGGPPTPFIARVKRFDLQFRRA